MDKETGEMRRADRDRQTYRKTGTERLRQAAR